MAWTTLAPGVLVRQSRAYQMNSAVLLRDGHALVFDPGVLPSEMTDIANRVAQDAPHFERVALVFTHPHWDHVLGRDWFPAATTFAHVGFADELKADEAKIEASAKKWIEGAGEPWPRPFRAFEPTLAVRGTARAELGPFEVVAHEIPGHCASQIAIHLPAEGVLVSADTLSDIEIPWLDAAPWVYRRSLTAMHWLFEQEDIRFLVPGHGAVAIGRLEGYRRVVRDLDYLLHLEQRVIEAHANGWSLLETQDRLAAMDYLGKDAAYPMNDVHRGNVKQAYESLVERAGEPEAPEAGA
jgi:glyoxylase-like metal-dependent hydrolase (beta-lactamase superfamily II)